MHVTRGNGLWIILRSGVEWKNTYHQPEVDYNTYTECLHKDHSYTKYNLGGECSGSWGCVSPFQISVSFDLRWCGL